MRRSRRMMNSFQGPAGNVTDKTTVGGIQQRMWDHCNRRVIDLVREIPATKLLDVGCGEGHLSARIAHENPGLEVTAVDREDPYLRQHWRQLRSSRLKFDVADVYE